ncbi:response regulator [Actimicrobium antarcticum]|uniref:Response regulator n=1 Tax=Actimicrobium antarcticum TaxID=1051899 RepID=A0ABP7SSC0_9BURK
MKPRHPSSSIASIVVVEDSDEDFDTLREVAAKAGIARVIHRVASGGDCLALLRGEGKVNLSLLPALIVMDLNSHGVDGREALMTIKNDVLLKAIPVVVLTTSANPKDMAFCYHAGANAYHVKPVHYNQYLLLLRSLMHYWLDSVTLHAESVKVS